MAIYTNLITACNQFSALAENNPRFRPSQKDLFASIAALFPRLGLETPTALDRDVYYHQAKLVNGGETFQAWSGSLQRLRPLASNYCLTFNEIISSLRNPLSAPQTLKEKFERLGNAHLEFARAFILEMTKAAPETRTVIHYKYPETLALLHDVVLPHFEYLKPQIDSLDENLLTLTLPCLAVEKLLAGPSVLPEFFLPYKELLIKKSATWKDLSTEEKQKLHRKILGEEIELAPCTQQLYQSIRHIITEIHRNQEQRKEFSMILKWFLNGIENQ